MSNPNTDTDERVKESQRTRLRQHVIDLLNGGIPWEFYDPYIGKEQRHDFAERLADLLPAPMGFHECNTPAQGFNAEREKKVANGAATRMRDLCVAKVKHKADSYQKDSERPDYLPNYRKNMALAASALREVANDLQSLTLEQGEQKKR